MKKLKGWLALVLAVTLVGANVLYSMGSALQANALETEAEVTPTMASADTQTDNSGTDGLDVTDVEKSQTDQSDSTADTPEPITDSASQTATNVTPIIETPENQTPENNTLTVEIIHDVIIQKANIDGGTIKAWTTGEKTDVTYDGNNQYKEELSEGMTFYFEITANETNQIEKVTDQNGTEITKIEENGKICTYEIANVSEDKIISVLYKSTAADKKARSAVDSATAAVGMDSYTVEYYMEDSLKENYGFNGDGVDFRAVELSGHLNAFGVFFQYGKPVQYIFAVKMVVMENVTATDSKGQPVEFRAGEVVSRMDGRDAKPVDKLRTATFAKDAILKLDVQPLTHTVTFLEEDGTLIKHVTVIDSLPAKAPEAKTLEHKRFTQWDTDFSKVTKDLTVKAQYEWTHYAVNYYLDESLEEDYVLSKGGGTKYTTWISVEDRLTSFGVWLEKKDSKPKEYVRSVTMVMRESVSGKSNNKDVTFEAGQIVSTFRDGNAYVIFGDGNLGHTNFDGRVQVNITVKSLYEDNTFGVIPYAKAYDGAPHSITFTGEDNLANNEVVEYSLNGTDEWSQEKPVFTNVTDTDGSTGVPVYVRVRDGNIIIWKGNTTVKILPVEITLMANADPNSKTYGDPEPDASAFTAQLTAGSFVGNDNLSSLKYTIARETGEDAKEYAIKIAVTPGENPNYDIKTVDGTFTITEKELIIKPVNDSKIYGDSDPTFKVTINNVEINSSDALFQELGIKVTREKGEDARIDGVDKPYELSVKTKDNKNYNITTQKGDFFIDKRPLTITVGNYTKTYGDADPQFEGTVDGWLEKDGKLDYTIMRTAGETVNNDGYSFSAVSTSTNNKNYKTPVLISSGKLTILPKSVTLTPSDSQKVYGELDTAFSFNVTDSSGTPDKTAKRELNYKVEPVPNEGETTVKNVGNYRLQATAVTSNANYSVNTEMGNYKITKRPVTLTANDASKRYETDDDAVELSASVTDGTVVPGDKLFYTVERTSSHQGEDVTDGGYQIDVVPTPGANPNYNITTKPGILMILPKETEVIITAQSLSKTYGEADPTLTATVDGADAGKLDYTVERKKGKNTGSYTTEVKLGDNPNYEHIEVVDGTFTIAPKPIGITVGNETKIYGQKDPVDSYTVSETGLLSGDQKPTYTFHRQQGSNVGNYVLYATIDATEEENISNKNYVLNTDAVTNGTLTISPKDAAITAKDSDKVYGESDPPLEAEVTGTVAKDTLNYTLIREKTENSEEIGNYNITVTPGENPNYNLETQNGELSILGEIFYQVNGGTGNIIDDTKYTRNQTVTLKDQGGITREGATFLGWSQQPYRLLETQQAQDEANSALIKEITIGAQSITLYAVWAQIATDTAGTPAVAAAPANPTTPVAPTTIIQTITQPLTALADRATEALNATVEEIVPVDENGVPLANKVATDHRCCFIHLLLLLAALIVEINYTKSAKKRQQRIFALREEIALADKQLQKQKDKIDIA